MYSFSTYFAQDMQAAFVLLLLLIGLLFKTPSPKSSKSFGWMLVTCLLACVCDAVVEIPMAVWLKHVAMYGFWLSSQFCLLFFQWYSYFYTRERCEVKLWPHFIPTALMGVCMVMIIVYAMQGRLYAIDELGIAYCLDKPYFVTFFNASVILFIFVFAVINRRVVGKMTPALVCFVGLAPYVTHLYADRFNAHNYSCLAASFAMIVAYIFIENKAVEEIERKRREEVESANKAKSTFLFNMSHDIRTAMNGIMGFANLLERDKEDKEKINSHIQKIKNSGEFLLGLINDVLDMARIESGKTELDEEFYDMKDPLNDNNLLFVEMARKKNIDFSYTQDVQHRYVWVDKTKIQRVILNILSNAIKYTPEGGKVTHTFTEIPCEREGYATYEARISDNGIGMSPEFVEHLYDSFSRERTSTESKIAGTGLGMSIVKRLVDLMGGTIKVQTELGKGTTFVVTLTHRLIEQPEKYLQAQLQANSKLNAVTLDGKRILLAEDNELNAEIVVTILEEVGLLVEHAEDGVKCIKMLDDHAPGYYDAILMDIQMPNLNGYEATRRIRVLSDPAKANIPIIALTANAFDEDKKNALEAGMNDHLAKPINIKNLVQTLSRLHQVGI